jgi:hypothetical protein
MQKLKLLVLASSFLATFSAKANMCGGVDRVHEVICEGTVYPIHYNQSRTKGLIVVNGVQYFYINSMRGGAAFRSAQGERIHCMIETCY